MNYQLFRAKICALFRRALAIIIGLISGVLHLDVFGLGADALAGLIIKSLVDLHPWIFHSVLSEGSNQQSDLSSVLNEGSNEPNDVNKVLSEGDS